MFVHRDSSVSLCMEIRIHSVHSDGPVRRGYNTAAGNRKKEVEEKRIHDISFRLDAYNPRDDRPERQ
jgi:hypothetical protein